MSIAILDYDMANLRSVQKAFETVGHAAQIINSPEQIDKADKLVLPGVGAFADAVNILRARNLVEPILRHIEKGKPLLGICLGLQILFDVGYEDGEHRGLGVLKGDELSLKVPHMGWNQLTIKKPSPLFKNLPDSASVYFVHSYYVEPKDESVIATTTDYGRPFVSSIWRDNLMATQFHPEKSQKVGLQILANFARL
jgi:imidazole glycerol-phosphate synthase subunit HisH